MATGQAKAWPVVHREATRCRGCRKVVQVIEVALGCGVPGLENETHTLREPLVGREVNREQVA
jgi:hypothetical protein